MPTVMDAERSFYISQLGLPETTNMTIQDLRNTFFTSGASQYGANRYRFTPQVLPKWVAAKARMRDGVGEAKLLMVGDSTTFGTGSTQAATLPSNGSPSTRVATLLTNAGVTSIPGFITPGADQRWTVPGNWTGNFFGFGSLANYSSAVSAGALVCTDTRVTWDRCDVYFLQGPGLGTVVCTATGGSGANGVGANAQSGIAKVTANAASANSANTISIVPTVATCHVTGVEFWRNGTVQLRVGNGGVGLTGAQQHAMQATTWGTIPMINAYAPDLVTIALGINDRGASRTLAQYRTDLQTIITGAKAVADVVLCTQMPSQNAPQATNEAAFNDVVRDLAYSNNVGLYDYYSRCGSWASYNSRGMANDALHQNNRGYWDFAEGLVFALMAV